MMRLDTILAIARAEGRLTRRLVRYWIFLVLAWGFGILGYIQYAFILHRNLSAWSATVAMVGPRYLIGVFGPWYILVFMVGLVFLAFDIRARDVRERFAEVLDAKPFSNLELVLGRCLGLLLLSWIPVLLITAFWGVLGAAIGESIQPLSLLDFAVFMTLPALTFTLGLVFAVSLLVRFRLVSAILVVAFIVAMVFGGQFVPVYLGSLFNVTGGFILGYPSDLLHFDGGFWGFAQRAAFFLTGIAMLVLSAALLPRLDDGSRRRRLIAGLGLAVVPAALFAGVIQSTISVVEDVDHWREAHAARKDDPAPDLLAMSADVNIRPGRSMEMDLNLKIAAPGDRTLEKALFSLNPGLIVERVTLASGEEGSFTQESGLLEVELASPLAPGDETDLTMSVAGSPNLDFAHLDAVRHPFNVSSRDAALFILGYYPAIFSRSYVALMPDARWLPAPGSEVGRADPRVRPSDYFMLDLEVELPEEWLAAGPGMRREGGSAPDGRVRYRFSPPSAVPNAALIAARFESRAVDLEGIRFEILVNPSHAGNVDFFQDAASEVQTWIVERVQEAEEMGLAYPYDGLTLVEVPTSLRGYGGGWRMDTTLAPPAMVLMKESAFPTARFDVPFKDPDRYRDQEGGVPRAKREWLERFFENDFTGGNTYLAATRNVFQYQTAGRGREGLPLDFVCEALTTRLLTGKQGYFSAHIFDRGLNALVGSIVQRYFISGGSSSGKTFADATIETMTSRTEVWDQALGVSLGDLDPWDDPRRALDVLTLKGNAMARSLVDGLGEGQAARLLSTMRAEWAGRSFSRGDVITAGREIGEDLERMLDLWLDQTDLPGFVLEKTEAYRLPDDEGSPRYQVLLTVRNDEPVAGLLGVEYRVKDDENIEKNEPIRVPGRGEMEIGIVTSKPPGVVTLVPYLSLNRESFRADLPAIDEEETVRAGPFRGAREVAWSASNDGAIVVDDLDEGFSVENAEGRSWLRLGARVSDDEETDQGLPVAAPFGRPDRWSRRTSGNAWGKYRHTLAVVRSGQGERRAIFTATIPSSAEWELQFHLPSAGSGDGRRRRAAQGTWKLVVEDGSGRRDVSFDAGAGEKGWNSLGAFEIMEGEVRVELSDETDARFVLADAIRWMPSRSSKVDMASR